MHRPDVTVVVMVQDDRDLLPAAVRSVTRQTLRNIEILIVNHGSADGTDKVAERLAAKDDRIRVIHLPDREGGPGRTCNAGFAEAAAPYVTLCASDDELPPDACRRLLATAQLHDAELVLGRTIRIQPEKGNQVRPWLHSTYEEEAAYDGIRERTGLLRDQISAGKLYSVDFIRRHDLLFPEDVIYEDQLFTLSCCVLARRIAVIPDVVYHWITRSVGKPSITHTRSQIANLRDRIEVNLRMDKFLREHDAEDLAPIKDAKFIEHDLRLYLNELWHREPAYQRDFIDILADYVTTFPYSVAEQLPTIYRVVLFMLRQRDLEGTLAACEYIREPGRVSTELTERDGRVYWGTGYLDDEQARTWLDVTSLGLHRIPFSQQNIYNYFTAWDVDGSTVRVSGVVRNELGQIGEGDPLTLTLLFRRKGAGAAARTKVDSVRWGPSMIEYDATLDFGALLPRKARPFQTWELFLVTRLGEHVNSTRVCVRDDALHAAVPVKRARAVVGPRWLDPQATLRGNLTFRATWRRPTRRLIDVGKGLLQSGRVPILLGTRSVLLVRGAAAWASQFRRGLRWGARRVRMAAFRTFLTRMELDDSLIVFESFQGRQASDSPRAIFDELRVTRPDLSLVWSLGPAGLRSSDLPRGTRIVNRGSWEYFKVLARARYWVDNFGMPRDLPKPARTTYLQTWHGTPVKRLFFDTTRVRDDAAEKRRFQRLVDRWDLLVSPSPFFEHSMVRSANFGGRLIHTGVPRTDALVRAHESGLEAATARARQALDLPTDRKILLFAPTYRSPEEATAAYTPLDLELLADALGDEWYVLLRDHYFSKPAAIEPGLRYFAGDVTTVPDLTTLMLASDALLTDFSSVMFDFALLRRPMLFYAPDLDYYNHVDPLTYFDLSDVVPGPVVRTQDELIAAIDRLEEGHTEMAARYDAFVARFSPREDGRATTAVIDAVWGPRAGSDDGWAPGEGHAQDGAPAEGPSLTVPAGQALAKASEPGAQRRR
jgi:CDP-glycerol glycerophosphotransferase